MTHWPTRLEPDTTTHAAEWTIVVTHWQITLEPDTTTYAAKWTIGYPITDSDNISDGHLVNNVVGLYVLHEWLSH